MKSRLFILILLVSLVFGACAAEAATQQQLLKRYSGMLDQLHTELKAKVPQPTPNQRRSYEAASKAVEAASRDLVKVSRSKSRNKNSLLRTARANLKAAEALLIKEKARMLEIQKTLDVKAFLASDSLDAKLVKYVVLRQATPEGLAQFASQGNQEAALIDQLLGNTDLMKQILVADGAKRKREGRSYGPAQYGPTMKIYTVIRKVSDKASEGVLQRLALAIALEHAIPVSRQNPKALTDGPEFIDPARRYLHYEKAYLAGELDSNFKGLNTWDLRMVVDGREPDETLAWGRQTLRNFRPDHVYQPNHSWRYVGIVSSDVKYGSGDNKYDRPELQFFQNILMNGGVCGRRAFFGRFMLRSWGIPTIARPSRGHAALARWTPKGWVVCLGPGWGGGKGSNYAGRYPSDRAFLATTQARANAEAYLQVKRAYWVGDVLGEKPTYGDGGTPEFWSGVALENQRAIIKEAKATALKAVGENLGEADGKEKATARPDTAEDKKIVYGSGGVISIPAAAYSKPAGSTKDVKAMKSFAGGLQIFLPRFSKKGVTVLRGGTWKGYTNACTSGARMKSGGYGRYPNWGFRAAVTHASNRAPRELTLDLGDGVKMEFVYIKPGAFAMGGENKADGRFTCVEVPKHAVTVTKGFYLGKYEVTQAQYQAIMGSNPSRSTKAADCPVDNVSWDEALKFCADLAYKSKRGVRLPTEAEWEYASRGGKDTKWFFGSDSAKLSQYAWFKDNAGGKSHPVGQKKPNPWGLYDIYGNVCERIADTYDKNYYAKSPKTDPTGPSQGTQSKFEYEITVPRAGKYSLTARVVTANYDQQLVVSANGERQVDMPIPFTVGKWRDSKPVTITLKKGANTLRFLRHKPPQKGVAIKSFALKPAR
jgi:formylglycine-generating enzyme required for sulfatase activity